MSIKENYYYKDQCPIKEHYREAEARTIPPPIPPRSRTFRKSSISRYDQEMYALPNKEDDGYTPDVRGNAFTPPNSSTPSRQVKTWKNIAILSSIIAMLSLGCLVSVVIYCNLSQDTKGKLMFVPRINNNGGHTLGTKQHRFIKLKINHEKYILRN